MIGLAAIFILAAETAAPYVAAAVLTVLFE
jgi:hypothetical protein